MAEALKHHIGPEVVRSLARDLSAAWGPFDGKAFARDALRGLEALELLPRGTHIAGAMRRHLPAAYPEAVRVLVDSLGPPLGESDLTGMAVFRYLPYVAFIREYGVDHFEESMAAQHALTQRFTAEWCIRPFIERYPDATLARLREWAIDSNVHVRRLVSEGTRPRLPWAPQLKAFMADPAPTLALLEMLKDDPERYVQRSVANHLNDIAKDHPDRVVAVARDWSRGASEGRAWIVQHALRSLIKRGHRGALTLLGGGAKPAVRVGRATFTPARVRVGQVVRFAFTLTSTSRRTQELIVDYTVHFVKADGSTKPKVFKLAKCTLAPGERVNLSGRVSLAVHTTRKPYPGRHRVDAQVNGLPYHLGSFVVTR
ncbi:MAG: DNA alkylation repair protein [Gemmatimonadetes bacterium]|nr:DNA alkylation repair protein [Gemmatimonadota bacterium]